MHKEPVCVFPEPGGARGSEFAEEEVGSKPIVYLHLGMREGEDVKSQGSEA